MPSLVTLSSKQLLPSRRWLRCVCSDEWNMTLKSGVELRNLAYYDDRWRAMWTGCKSSACLTVFVVAGLVACLGQHILYNQQTLRGQPAGLVGTGLLTFSGSLRSQTFPNLCLSPRLKITTTTFKITTTLGAFEGWEYVQHRRARWMWEN